LCAGREYQQCTALLHRHVAVRLEGVQTVL
jgi:hypothetical protein